MLIKPTRRELVKYGIGAVAFAKMSAQVRIPGPGGGGNPAAAGHTGTVQGSPTFAAAKFSNGLTAVTGSNYILLPTGTFSWTSSSSWAVSAQLQTTATSLEIAVSSGAALDANALWFGVLSNGHFGVSVTGTGAFSGGAALDSGITINDGSFHHCELDMAGGTTIKLFVDGTQGGGDFVGQINNPPNDHTGGVIGKFSVIDPPFVWTGAIDEVAIWSAAAHSSNFTAPSAAYTGSETNMYALYHLQSDGTDSSPH